MNNQSARMMGLGIVLLLLVSGTMLSAAPVFSAAPAQSSAPMGPGTDPVDVVVLLDDSGSMATCWPWPREGLPYGPPCGGVSYNDPSDPDELRYSAARLLVQLLDEADRVSVIRFDSTAEGVGALGVLQQAGSPENRRRLAGSLQPPTNYLPRGYTRMDLGLEEAIRLLEANREPNRNQYVLLLTDGEPTAPGTLPFAEQRRIIREQLEKLRAAGVLVFPVVLCNPTSGCSGDFLREQSSTEVARDAGSASDLLQVFSQLLAEMKSDRSIVTQRNANGHLSFRIRAAHGVRELAFVSPRAALSSVRRDGAPVLTRNLLNDGNVELNMVEGELLPGDWSGETRDLSAFAVVQADSYPELVFPPPSALNSPASVRYYPADKPPLLVVRGVGPAAGEPLLLDGQTRIPPIGQDGNGVDALAAIPFPGGDEATIQLGEDSGPLQLRRTFRLQARADLPRVEVFTPRADNTGILEDGRIHLEVGFGPGLPVQGLAATVYVNDTTDDAQGGDRPVYQAEMTCVERTCVDEAFTPGDGRSYRVTYLVNAVAEGVRFGDWARAAFDVEPAVFLRGLPSNIDLAKMPPEGWPISVAAGSVDDIGSLTAALSLRKADTGEPVNQATLNFEIDVPEQGSQTGFLRVEGLDLLRPGEYVGEITLTAQTPASRPMEVNIRPAPVLPVTLTVPRSAARIESQVADFGELPFDTSPNFRLDEEVLLPVTFEPGKPFRLTAELAESFCPGLDVTAGELQVQGNRWLLPVRLQSQTPVLPGVCSGRIRFRGPSEDFDVFPDTLDYRIHVLGVEWSVVGSLDFGDLGRAGERSVQTVLVRFDGKTPFMVKVVGVKVAGETDRGVVALDESFLEAPSVEVRGEPDANGFYPVEIALTARKAIPKDPVRGSFYSGDLVLGIEGLPGETRTVDVAFRSPTAYQRYVEWWLRPIYSLPWLLCTGPLTLLLLLILMARVRSRGYPLDEEEPVVTLPTPELQPEPESAFVTPAFEDITAHPPGGDVEVSWGSPWGEVDWGFGPAREGSPVETPAWSGNGSAQDQGDPWQSSW